MVWTYILLKHKYTYINRVYIYIIYISHIPRKNPDEKKHPTAGRAFSLLTSALFKASTIFGPSPRIHLLRIVQKQSACVFLFSCAYALDQSSSIHVLLTSGLSLEFLRSLMQWSSRWNLGRVLQYLSRKFNDLPARDMYIERNIDPTISLWSCSSSVRNISACASMPTHESAAQRQVHISFRATCMPGFVLTGGFCESLLHQPAQHYICIESLTFQLGVGIRDPCQILFGELWQGEAQTTWLGIPLQLQRCMGERLLNAGPSKVPFPHQNFQCGSEQVTPTAQVKGMKKIDRQHLDAKTSAQCQTPEYAAMEGLSTQCYARQRHHSHWCRRSSNHWCPWTPHSASKTW